MYEERYGLRKAPFSTTPDPSCLYLTPMHREALAGLVYSIQSRKGFVVMTGDAGTGKSTLIRKLVQTIPPSQMRTSIILNPTLKVDEFMEMVLMDFGITDIPAGKLQRLLRLQEFLLETDAANQTAVLIVDEAHKLSAEVLEETRLLTNLESADRKLLQIVLTGQTELAEMLNRDDMRQLKQRIAVRLRIDALNPPQVPYYMQFRWKIMGSDQSLPFTAQAIELVAKYSSGIPRLINAISDNALVLSIANSAGMVGIQEVTDAARDLDLIPRPAAPQKSEGKSLVGVVASPLAPSAAAVQSPNGIPIRLRALERYQPAKRRSWLLRVLGAVGIGRIRVKNEQDLRSIDKDRIDYGLDTAKDPG